MEKRKIGFAVCASFCTFATAIKQMSRLKELDYDIYPIMSSYAYNTDTRFGKATDFIDEIEKICEKRIMHTISDVERVGPDKLLDLLVVAPCTGNTLSKLANGITDSSITMAAKAHLRNDRPVLIGLSSNDSLSASAKNLGLLLNQKNIYFIPMGQDDAVNKPASLVAKFELLPDSVGMALEKKQLQPILR